MNITRKFLSPWRSASQISVALASIVFTFVQSPPALSLSGSGAGGFTALVRFLITIIVLVFLTAAIRQSSGTRWKRWLLGGIAALVSALLAFALYRFLLLSWTCNVSGIDLTIGRELSREAAVLPEYLKQSCGDLLGYFASDPLRVWQHSLLYTRQTILSWCFVLTVSLFTIAAIAVLQAHKIAHR